jgi:ferredoxin-nitrate reductase
VPPLNEAAPAPFVEISHDDARRLDLRNGDRVLMGSRRGSVEIEVKASDIAPGHLFMPFHYGDWDTPGGHRASNELTISDWDPVSKQPHFKFAAVWLRKS